MGCFDFCGVLGNLVPFFSGGVQVWCVSEGRGWEGKGTGGRGEDEVVCWGVCGLRLVRRIRSRLWYWHL